MDPKSSPEYRTLITHNVDLILAMKNNVCQLGDVFVSRYLITPGQSSELRNEHISKKNRAAALVDWIQSKVLESTANYHTFVNVLKDENEKFYKDILRKLQMTYSHYGQEGILSSESQCRKSRRLNDGSSQQQSLDNSVADTAVASPISSQLQSIRSTTAPPAMNSEESDMDTYPHKLPHRPYQHAVVEPCSSTSQSPSTFASSISPSQHVPTASQLPIPPRFQKYRPKLANMYAYQSKIPQDVWPPVKRVHYINLALIKRKQLDIGNEYARHTIRGSVDDIFQEKDEIKYDCVFEDVEDGARILLEGRPGCGKTTVMHKISQDWKKGEIFPSSLLFLVPLRRFSNKSNIKLADVIRCTTREFSQDDVTDLCKRIEQDSGKGFVFALDGLDEYRPDNKKDNLIFDLIEGKYLLNSVVIVASRPSASQKFRKFVSKHIEVLGFIKQQIDEFIDSYYADNGEQGVELKKYLEHHPNVLHMCYLPIHIVMVTYLFEKMGSSLPQTETEIYRSFTIHTLVRSIRKRKDSDESVVLRSFDDLQGDDANLFQLILELAFTATVNSKQVFSQSEEKIRELFTSCHHGEANETKLGLAKLGLLTVDQDYILSGIDNIYTFLHLTFQEYLAACYVARLDQSKQNAIIKQYANEKHLAVVWKFYCGMTRFEFTCENGIKNFELIVSETPSNNLLHIQCAFESQQKGTCTCVVQSNKDKAEIKIYKESLTAADCTALSYVLVSSEVAPKVVELISCRLGPEGFTAFVKGCCDHSLLELESLSLEHSKIKKGTETSFCEVLKLCPNLHNLNISSCGIQYGMLKSMCSNFPCLSKLETLDLSSNPLGKTSTPLLERLLERTPNLKKLRVDVQPQNIGFILSKVGTIETTCPGRCIFNQTTIKLDYKCKGVAWAQAVGEGLKHCTSIQTLDLGLNVIGDAGAQAIGEGLKHCTSIQTLELTRNEIGDAGAQAIGEGLKHCTRIQTLDLGINEIGDAGAQAIGEGLKHCTSIQTLKLYTNLITDKSVNVFCDLIERAKQLEMLNLHSNKMTSDGKATIRSAEERRKSNPDFVELCLYFLYY